MLLLPGAVPERQGTSGPPSSPFLLLPLCPCFAAHSVGLENFTIGCALLTERT
jgi:hypothetical protein